MLNNSRLEALPINLELFRARTPLNYRAWISTEHDSDSTLEQVLRKILWADMIAKFKPYAQSLLKPVVNSPAEIHGVQMTTSE